MTILSLNGTGRARRLRRPSGEPSPLPHPIYRSGRVYVVLTVLASVVWIASRSTPALGDAVHDVDTAVATVLRHLDGRVVHRLADAVGVLGSRWTWRIIRWTTIIGLIATRRMRHLLVLGVVVLAVTTATTPLASSSAPQPSRTVALLGVSLIGAVYTLAPRGRPRNRAKVIVGAVMAVMIGARLLLAVDTASGVAFGLLVGMAIPVVLFRWLTPNEIFPIVYGRDRRPGSLSAAHDAAICAALRADHGWDVRDAHLLRPPGSKGSTPMVASVVTADGNEVTVFAKLYSRTHLRADRWYKLGRAILYGRLEDEAPFASVRQLVEHEDYVLRLAADGGLPVPGTYGISELTPGRDYILVMEMLPDAKQLGHGRLTDDQIDQGLAIVRGLWSARLAHRDIKPANLVLSNGRLHLVDVSFGEVRPSPWREAVDLATMMLTLALDADPADVYARAARAFEPEEIGEAFAAARSVTVPSQLRSLLRERDRSLPARFAAMAPPHPPIAIQRWSVQRIALTTAALGAAVVVVALVAYNLSNAGHM
jgi:tRNA A-37 threonylcarbamoyl transferase component Bud32